MKKHYEAPRAEIVKFQYSDQVVAASGTCLTFRLDDNPCKNQTPIMEKNIA